MSVLSKPLVSEKMELLNERSGNNQYSFKVDLKAKKPAIREAIEEMYGVDVQSLRTMIVRGKRRTRHTRAGFIHGKSPNYKKAIVTLGDGQEIDFYKNI